MIKLKVGRNILNLDENDLILDNGSCYQIVTKEVRRGFDYYHPVMAKKLFNDLKKTNLIFTNHELRQAAINKYRCSGVTYWKFNIAKMKEFGY